MDSTDTVCVPKQHAVFTFALKHCVSRITWYPASNLVSVDGRLYSVFFEHNHLLGSYAWLSTLNETVSEEYLTVENTPLTYTVSDGILIISGMHIHRRTGVRASGTSFTKCVEMRPAVPWYSKGFDQDLETVYRRPSERMRLSSLIVILQRWWRRRTPDKSRKAVVWKRCRNVSLFDMLSDDLFSFILDFTVCRPRHRRSQFRPLLP